MSMAGKPGESESSPVSSNSLSYHGIYRPNRNKQRTRKGKKEIEEFHNREFHRSYSNTNLYPTSLQYDNNDSNMSHFWDLSFLWRRIINKGYPSVTSFSIELMTSISAHDQDDVSLVYHEELSTWCFLHHHQYDGRQSLFCKVLDTMTKVDTNAILNIDTHLPSSIRIFPPSGTWTIQDPSSLTTAMIDVSCPASEYIHNPSPAAKPSVRSNPASTTTTTPQNGLFASFFLNSKDDHTLMEDIRQKKKLSRQFDASGIHVNDNLHEIIQYPATSLLIILNITLAFLYWNHRSSPQRVAIHYERMVTGPYYELWRCLTGQTAHFEIWHLGFNMLSLHNLGIQLEGDGGYGSIPFLYRNICLMPWTTLVYVGFIRLQIWMVRNDRLGGSRSDGGYGETVERLRQTSGVGFSGILFAWLVVSCLKRNTSCITSKLCFQTYEIMNIPLPWSEATDNYIALKFNWMPIIHLVIAQLVMRRVSFLGHLSGIVCGFILHWDVLPMEVFWCPQVVFPAGLLFHWWWVRGVGVVVVPWRRQRRLDGCGGGWVCMYDIRENRLAIVKNAMLSITLLSFVLFDVTGSLVLGQVLAFTMFALAVRSVNATTTTPSSQKGWEAKHFGNIGRGDGHPSGEKLSGIFWRGVVVTLVVLLICDAMTISTWIIPQHTTFLRTNRPFTVGLFPVICFGLLRLVVNFMGLLFASEVLCNLGEVGGGVFDHVLGWIVRSSKALSLYTGTTRSPPPVFVAFEGRGVALGGGITSSV